tara:strand:+ start:95 stop:406 length:312 start_codon:yes stop_codon:yes gene_type:complete
MKRSEMNPGQKSKHVEKVCKSLLIYKRAYNKIEREITSQIMSLKTELNGHLEEFNLTKSKICAIEEISPEFINSILSGRQTKYKDGKKVIIPEENRYSQHEEL